LGAWLARPSDLADVSLILLTCFLCNHCHTAKGRKWFARSPSVPRHWFPREDLDAKSFAFGVQFGRRSDDSAPRKIGADAWFDRQGAARFMVREQIFRVARDETVSLVIIDDKAMLDDR
jgi:hypothetical protein